MSEQLCSNCNKSNPIGSTYCYSCGHILPAGMKVLATQHLGEDERNLRPQLRWGTAYFGEQTFLRIHVSHTAQLIETRFDTECILGRVSEDDVATVDLSPFNAIEMGVSRRHAKLTRQSATIMVQDLDSVNGTYLNGENLLPFQARGLRNEDEIQLGHMQLRISFLRAPGRP